jgi:hypothetical protein
VESKAVANLSELIEGVLEITAGAQEHEWWFRGHGRSSFTLLPSLYRTISDVGDALAMEGRLLREFDNRSRTLPGGGNTRDSWETLFLMQHHRVPTRLLDWSRNLLIAAYFAVHDQEAWSEEVDPPCVYVFNSFAWNTTVLGTAGVAGSLGPVTELAEGSMMSYAPRAAGSPIGPPQENAVAISGPEFAARIVAQRGVFTVFGTKPPEANRSLEDQDTSLSGDSSLHRFTLDGSESDWKQALRIVGIGAFTAFPDLDGLANELKDTHLA